MSNWAMAIDVDRCNGCQACVVACRAENNLPMTAPDQAAMGRDYHWISVRTQIEGTYPRLRTRYFPMMCMHCERPPCVKVCPVGATYVNPEGLVGQIYNRCIGCRYCTVACPYLQRVFNWYAPEWPEPMERQFNPEVSIRPKGVVEKCSFCSQRIRQVKQQARREERAITDAEVQKLPACAASCPADAMVFGDLDDPDSEVSRWAHSPRAFQMLHDLGTHPKVFYLRDKEAL